MDSHSGGKKNSHGDFCLLEAHDLSWNYFSFPHFVSKHEERAGLRALVGPHYKELSLGGRNKDVPVSLLLSSSWEELPCLEMS